eukprot:CAMPEP_0118951360 /NCGR_PEP_ID=MMETSP1169-20130426/52965_1 /TAXON_ID=36882 /ORGANISM="Pyramimonas obovata, Strain CCMP722" /LENGTH=509 /DNA_ID=CAMNT_0006898401 /DNA_START=160 /DNA_END=1690 /DNA_ORIENTATION=+
MSFALLGEGVIQSNKRAWGKPLPKSNSAKVSRQTKQVVSKLVGKVDDGEKPDKALNDSRIRSGINTSTSGTGNQGKPEPKKPQRRRRRRGRKGQTTKSNSGSDAGSTNTPKLKAKPMLKETPNLLEIVSEELTFRWESAKRGQWRPGSCSSDAYMNADLRSKDREFYAAAGVLPYATALSDGTEGLWLLMGRRGLSPNRPDLVDTLVVLGGKREVYDQSAVHTAAREAAEETEGLFKRATLELMLGGGRGSPVLWCPQGRYAVYLMPMPAHRVCISDEFNELVDLNPRPNREVVELEWVDMSDLAPHEALGVLDLHPFSQQVLRQPSLASFLRSVSPKEQEAKQLKGTAAASSRGAKKPPLSPTNRSSPQPKRPTTNPPPGASRPSASSQSPRRSQPGGTLLKSRVPGQSPSPGRPSSPVVMDDEKRRPATRRSPPDAKQRPVVGGRGKAFIGAVGVEADAAAASRADRRGTDLPQASSETIGEVGTDERQRRSPPRSNNGDGGDSRRS